MRRVSSITLVLVLLSLVPTTDKTSASASETANTPRVLADCKSEPVIPCIEEIKIRTKDGKVISTELTGRSAPVDREFIGRGYEEYSVEGLNFEGTSKNLFIPRIVHYRYPPQDGCDTTGYCENERDHISVAIQPSWLNRWSLNLLENEIPLSKRPSSLLCGTAQNREKCYRSNNFEIEIDFLLKLRVPITFMPMWASGSARNLTIDDWNSWKEAETENYSLDLTVGTLDREMVLFSDFYENPLDAIESSPFADFKADWPVAWIHSARDRTVNLLQECRDIPFLSVSTNGIYQEVPVWNPTTETIDLKLYAPHLKVDGGLNRGFYELKISERLAKCFWKIDVSERTQARVIINYPDSTSDVVIETTRISFSSGVLEVLATNFTFSSPTIKTQVLKAEAPPTRIDLSQNPVLPRVASTVVKVAKKVCVKGTKKVRVERQKKCPSGFKRS